MLPLAVATHLAGEFGALGVAGDAPIAFGPHHAYLALVVLASLAAAALIVRDAFARGGSRATLGLIAALPFRGEGPRFVALCVAVQTVFFVVTQAIEGSPVHAGDVVLGAIVAGVTALCSSLAIVRLKRALLSLALRLCRSWFVARRSRVVWSSAVRTAPRTARRRWDVLASRANRPPPEFGIAV